METTINEVSPVELEFELTATSEELEPRIEKELKDRRSDVKMEGFREGKVPLDMVRKMYGKQVALEVIEDLMEQKFREEVVQSDEYTVLGNPETTGIDYEPGGDLRATIKFGRAPEFELEDVSGEQITRLVHEVDDEEVDDWIEQQLMDQADLVPKEEAADEEDYVQVDIQIVDCQSGTAVVGQKDEGVEFFLNDPRVHEKIRDGLIGLKPGETTRVDVEHGHGEGGEAHLECYQIEVKAVKERDLPPFDEEFVRDMTDGQMEDPDAFREEVAHQLQSSWDERAKGMFEQKIVDTMVEKHAIPVPSTMVERVLDGFVEDVKQRNDGDLPDDFDETAFREENRGEAEKQARWRFIRDKVAENEGLEVEEQDFQDYYEQQADRQVAPQQLANYIEQMPGMKEQVRERILTQKVLDHLAEQFEIEEKDRAAIEEEMRARQQAQAQAAQAQARAQQGGGRQGGRQAGGGPQEEEGSDSGIVTPG